MKRIATLNSLYEIDEENKRFRRVSGKNAHVLDVEDGDWSEYQSYERIDRGIDEESAKVQYIFWLKPQHSWDPTYMTTSLVTAEVEA